jgi:hypothetical protein
MQTPICPGRESRREAEEIVRAIWLAVVAQPGWRGIHLGKAWINQLIHPWPEVARLCYTLQRAFQLVVSRTTNTSVGPWSHEIAIYERLGLSSTGEGDDAGCGCEDMSF